MAKKTTIVKIRPDGTVEIDQVGYAGKACSVEAAMLTKALGREPAASKKKPEYYRRKRETDIETHLG